MWRSNPRAFSTRRLFRDYEHTVHGAKIQIVRVLIMLGLAIGLTTTLTCAVPQSYNSSAWESAPTGHQDNPCLDSQKVMTTGALQVGSHRRCIEPMDKSMVNTSRNDSTVTKEQRLRETLECRILDERIQANHRINAYCTQRTSSLHPSLAVSLGLRPPALATTKTPMLFSTRQKPVQHGVRPHGVAIASS